MHALYPLIDAAHEQRTSKKRSVDDFMVNNIQVRFSCVSQYGESIAGGSQGKQGKELGKYSNRLGMHTGIWPLAWAHAKTITVTKKPWGGQLAARL